MKLATLRKRTQRAIPLQGLSCPKCGSTYRLQRHHPDYGSERCEVICQKCHIEFHKAEGTWGRGVKTMKLCVICEQPFDPGSNLNVRTCGPPCFSELGRRNARKRWGPEKHEE
jgi:hypothetical protein